MPIADVLARFGQQNRQQDPLSALGQGMQYGQQFQQMQKQREQQNLLEQLGPRAAAGDREAINQMAAINPELSAQYAERSAAQRQQTGNLLQMVKNAPEGQKPQVYQYARKYAIQNLGVSPERMPEQYDPMYVQAIDTQMAKGMGGKSGPASVQEYQFYQSLSPQEQDKYLRMKRADPTLKYGDVPMVGGQATRTVQPYSEVGAEQPQTQEELQSMLSRQEAEKAAQTQSTKAASKRAEAAFDQLGKVKSNIASYDEAIRLVREEGAETGPLVSRFPSLRQSSIALDNLQAQLGLDVIGNTTFGALSESELKFALSAALPTGLEGEELVDWLQRKKSSQQKLANYLEEAAMFLGTPGNTVKDWVEFQKEKGKPNETGKQRMRYNPATGEFE